MRCAVVLRLSMLLDCQTLTPFPLSPLPQQQVYIHSLLQHSPQANGATIYHLWTDSNEVHERIKWLKDEDSHNAAYLLLLKIQV